MTAPQEPPAQLEPKWVRRAIRYLQTQAFIPWQVAWALAEIHAWERAVTLGEKVTGGR